ncbi:regulator of volume decrease after cellular swelling-domain-containing protein [Dactylonectria estremocensis]|uniref:Regulator of volume decrease after cellular swelling-domain-containing protein n=1 Tax=Dactylonectria estremocensis TaxID=1079267 RepID=A0A9P9JCF7_9HYPO|nr:regulator of volume decrease after cellular swelling-domain-containing protein [Dactylonectria estremocensis]
MLPTTIRTPPAVGDFTPLSEYQAQTPETFVGGKPVLHFHVTGAKAWIPKSQCGKLALFPADSSQKPTAPEGDGINGDAEELVEQNIDIFVNSENFTIFSPQVEAGVSIPYPLISIHAVKQVGTQAQGSQTQAVWMQLEFSDGGSDDDDFNTVELTVIPPSADSDPNPTKQLYEAMANCSDLNPDPNNGEEDDEDEYDRIVFEGSAEHEAIEGFTGVMRGSSTGGLPPPMPGSGGWITADNVNDYFDADGNWIGQGAEEDEELGEGAGRVRARDEVEGDGAKEDRSAEDPENKRPRVD